MTARSRGRITWRGGAIVAFAALLASPGGGGAQTESGDDPTGAVRGDVDLEATMDSARALNMVREAYHEADWTVVDRIGKVFFAATEAAEPSVAGVEVAYYLGEAQTETAAALGWYGKAIAEAQRLRRGREQPPRSEASRIGEGESLAPGARLFVQKALLASAELQYLMGTEAEALESLNQLGAWRPVPDDVGARADLVRGWAYLAVKRYRDAEQTFGLLHDSARGTAADLQALFARGDTRVARGDLAGALEDYRQVARVNPDFLPRAALSSRIDATTDKKRAQEDTASPATAPQNPLFVVQVGAFADPRLAHDLVTRLEREGYAPTILTERAPGTASSRELIHKVRLGPITGRRKADALVSDLWMRLGLGSFVVPIAPLDSPAGEPPAEGGDVLHAPIVEESL
ncbi:MAG: SPOR domain-containing protein [Candidatus Schekmanbacteria bacterium]|nr:SPOR domain-containing protein [Candidatus Schekmanbacteria bacterium]